MNDSSTSLQNVITALLTEQDFSMWYAHGSNSVFVFVSIGSFCHPKKRVASSDEVFMRNFLSPSLTTYIVMTCYLI